MEDESSTEEMRLELHMCHSESRKHLSEERGEDGPLVRFPPNFDSIVTAMTREDLESNEPESWSRVLLSAPFGQDAEFEQGRYRELFSSGYQVQEEGFKETEEQRRVQRGMAEIALLDRQLRAALRRAKEASSTEEDIEAKQQDQDEFWKKQSTSIAFVKHFQAHLGRLHGLVVSPDSRRLVTSAADRMLKFFDIQSFDMTNMVLTETNNASGEGFMPSNCCWLVEGTSRVYSRVAVSDENSGVVRIYRAEESGNVFVAVTVHVSPVLCLALVPSKCFVISADTRGIIEYWDTESFELPGRRSVAFERKTDTDLYELCKARTRPESLCVSPSGEHFVVSGADRLIRVFDVARGKLLRKYDESLATYAGVDATRLATERELLASPTHLALGGLCFDDSGFFIAYSTLVGIKLVNIVTNKVVRVLGAGESERFLALALYQGVPKVQ